MQKIELFSNIDAPKENTIYFTGKYSCTLLIACNTQVHLGAIGSWLKRESGFENRLLLLALVRKRRHCCVDKVRGYFSYPTTLSVPHCRSPRPIKEISHQVYCVAENFSWWDMQASVYGFSPPPPLPNEPHSLVGRNMLAKPQLPWRLQREAVREKRGRAKVGWLRNTEHSPPHCPASGLVSCIAGSGLFTFFFHRHSLVSDISKLKFHR